MPAHTHAPLTTSSDTQDVCEATFNDMGASTAETPLSCNQVQPCCNTSSCAASLHTQVPSPSTRLAATTPHMQPSHTAHHNKVDSVCFAQPAHHPCPPLHGCTPCRPHPGAVPSTATGVLHHQPTCFIVALRCRQPSACTYPCSCSQTLV